MADRRGAAGAYPCGAVVMFTGLLLQAILFQFGGITTLGVNTVILAVPALAAYGIFKAFPRKQGITAVSGFIAGFTAIILSTVLAAASLITTGEGFLTAGKLILAVNIPAGIIEGIITAAAVTFLMKVRPEILNNAS